MIGDLCTGYIILNTSIDFVSVFVAGRGLPQKSKEETWSHFNSYQTKACICFYQVVLDTNKSACHNCSLNKESVYLTIESYLMVTSFVNL